jgi:hypothetical protein
MRDRSDSPPNQHGRPVMSEALLTQEVAFEVALDERHSWESKVRSSNKHAIGRLLRGGVLASALVAAMLGTCGFAEAAPATDGGSFPGCPLLVEDSPNNDPGCVVQLQDDLNASLPGAYNLDPDGNFGRLTRIAVLDFQGRNHLPADGNVGEITANALMAASASPQPAPSVICDISQSYFSGGYCVSVELV